MSRNKFRVAGQAEMLRAAQKDENYIHQLNEGISNVALDFGGVCFWLKYARYHIILSKLMYYASTSLCKFQTLGEEYSGIIPLQDSSQKLLTFKKLLVYVILLSGGQSAMEEMLICAEKITLPEYIASYVSPIAIHNAARYFSHLLPYLQRLNKIAFYWNGSYYSFVNRLLGVKHVLIESWLRDEASLYGFKILAAVSIVNIIVSFYHLYPSCMNTNSDEMNSSISIECESKVTSRSVCQLCLKNRKNTSITPCGHLFCWTCVMKWLQLRKDCPICKTAVCASRITFLSNYEKNV
ncbi:peroxisome biogenesis factor 10-like [Hetaerina americana]|uniref:peroxisome biogenesis factor 10-like n=1 Tax=Hetaerina americana TaxID=62018 RepID=UPI003A7F3010